MFVTLSAPAQDGVAVILLDLADTSGSVIKPKPPPSEFRLFRPGLNSTLKGEFLFDEASANSVMLAASSHGADLPIDYDHAMVTGGLFDAMDPSERGKAAGWFNLAVKDGELWAVNVKWTPKAALAITNGEWRYASPAIGFDPDTRRILRVTNVAITNLPATDHPDPLRALSQKTISTEVLMFPEALLKMLGLGKDATEAQVLSALMAMQKDVSDVAALRADVVSLRASAAKAESEKLNAEIEAAVKDGRVVPAQREILTALGVEKPEVVRQILSTSTPRVNMESTAQSAPAAPAATPGSVVTLGQFDKQVAKMLGLKPEQMIETRKMLADKALESV